MNYLLETIKVEDGKVFNLPYHQKRFNRSRKELFNSKKDISLSSTIIDVPLKGLYRCRVVYGKNIHSVEYIPYKEKSIENLKVVSLNISYKYKYENRDIFNKLLEKYSIYDELIIVKDGYVTDTTISNLAFYDGTNWFTPQIPLLKGTMREKLLDNSLLQTKKIKIDEIDSYKKVALINAMIGFKIINPTIDYSEEIL